MATIRVALVPLLARWAPKAAVRNIGGVTFAGIPETAYDFYDDLEIDNSKVFWNDHKHIYQDAVREPMEQLAGLLEEEFGAAKLFRPYRDVRFAADKSPYKTHQGLYVSAAEATGWYAEVSAAGFLVAAGFYHASSTDLRRIRAAIDGSDGLELQRLVAELESASWERSGETLKTTPRGYDANHPRIDLLRHKSLSLTKHYHFADFVGTPTLTDHIRADWRTARPFVEWVASHIGG